jgi:hypothetical protein
MYNTQYLMIEERVEINIIYCGATKYLLICQPRKERGRGKKKQRFSTPPPFLRVFNDLVMQ